LAAEIPVVCTARCQAAEELKAWRTGARLFIGFESGDPQILKNIKKGTTVGMAQVHEELQKEWESGPRRFHYQLAGRDQRDHQQDH
jgi:hypothetical protein